MPFAPQIRKAVLQALEQHILPQLQSQQVLQVPIVLPFAAEGVEHWSVANKHLPHQAPDPLQVAWHWTQERMTAGRFPYIGFIYEGVADYRFGVTNKAATELKKQKQPALPGQFMVRLPAPAVVYVPPFTPGHSGSEPFHDAKRPGGGEARMFFLSVMHSDIRLHLCHSHPQGIDSSHSLQIHDPLLGQMAHLYWEELKASGQTPSAAAQAQLFVFMCRLQRRLQSRNVPLGNSAWAVTQSKLATVPHSENEEIREYCRQAMDYIETRLNGKLSRASIAAGLGISPDHLGRVFHSGMGTTVMRYVTVRRVEAAKLILQEGRENVHEIAGLVGFANTTGFCAAFKRQTGQSPISYRRKHKAAG
jgi:AraC-like DNA-binding protein